MLDCDVEEPNDHLFLKPVFSGHRDMNVLKPVLDSAKCTGCGKCAEACNYKAIAVIRGKVLLFNELCHSCGVCAWVCPEKAFREKEVRIGTFEAADLHLLFEPRVKASHPFVGGSKASIDPSKCIACGKCAELCHFNAIRFDGPANDIVQKTYRIESFACEGCGLCPRVCPAGAIRSEKAVTGNWFDSVTAWGPMAHARLGIAEENSGRLVTQVRNHAAELARELHLEKILGDGPPGTGCPVIASVSGTDLVVIVTEPTVSGVHDMERVLELAAHFGVPTVVIVNKDDINPKQAARIADIAGRRKSAVIGGIPFDRAVNDALMAGETVIAHGPGPAADAIRSAWEAVRKMLKN